MRPDIDNRFCIGCSTCLLICPEGNFVTDGIGKVKVNPKKIRDCDDCRDCVDRCPNDAIRIVE